MSWTDIFKNAAGPSAILSQAIDSAATQITVNTASSFPTLADGEQCRLAIQDTVVSSIEIVIAQGPSSGTTFTVVRAQEGTVAAAHVQGAMVSPVITAFHLCMMFPKPPRVVTDIGDAQILIGDQIVIIDLAAPEPVTVNPDPATLLPGKIYNLSNGMNTAVTLQSGGQTIAVLVDDVTSVDFFSDGSMLRVK